MKKWISLGTLIIVFCACAEPKKALALTQEGLGGQEMVCVAVHPLDDSFILLGTEKGLYRFDGKRGLWVPFCEGWSESVRVNQVRFSPDAQKVYVATNKGAYEISTDGRNRRKIFERSDPLEADCQCFGSTDGRVQVLGTRKGLFIRNDQADVWEKVVSPFESDPVVSIYAANGAVYVAGPTEVYVSTDAGRTWKKIFNLYPAAGRGEADIFEASAPGDENNKASPVRYLAGAAGDPPHIYVGTDQGIFASIDGGKSWEGQAQSGLDIEGLRALVVYPGSGLFLAVSKTGVYRPLKDGWENMVLSDDARDLVFWREGILVISKQDIRSIPLRTLEEGGTLIRSDDPFGEEPTVQEVQQMAILYGDLSNEKIRSWKRAARLKALLPKLSYDRDKTVTTALGASYDKTQVGPQDWGISLSWDFSDLVYNESQTSIDNRAKLMVDQRNDILSEVTRLYFERRKVQIESGSDRKMSEAEQTSKRLRLMELTALIDRLTGGTYSKLLKSR